MIKKRFISMLVLLMTAVTGAWADDTYTVQFKANGNTKTVENVVLPHQFRCNFDEENGELDQIIKELYGWSRGYCCWEDISSSGNENVTCGSSNGEDYITISAPFEGTATVTGWYNPYSDAIQYSLEISIPGYVAPTVNVTGITLDKTEASMIVGGETLTLTPTVAPGNATDKTVTWTTSDAGVATVVNGVVTAVAAGTATITATATNGTADTSDDFSATCEVTVSPAGYSVALKEGTEDATNWQGKAGTGDYQALPLEGVAAGTAVSVKYNGTKKVKSVKAKKKAPAGPTSYTLAESTVGMVVGTNGLAYAVADKDNLPTGVTVAGLVAYKNGDNGLAIALTDEPNTMDWDNAMGESGAKAHTPAVTGQTWKLPSSDDIVNMLSSYDSYWPDLNEAIANVGGTGLLGGTEDIYWLSDESDESEDEARYMRELSDEPRTTSKGETYLVRSVIAF